MKIWVVLLLLSSIVVGVGCKGNKPILSSSPRPAGVITQISRGDCSPNIASTEGSDVNVQSPCSAAGQNNVTKTDGSTNGSITQISRGDCSPNIASTEGNVTMVFSESGGCNGLKGKKTPIKK